MKSTNESGEEFLKRLTDIVNENLTNKQFGVSMLASKMGMSRANLHRKVNTIAATHQQLGRNYYIWHTFLL